jgi:hypothetical protein
MQEIFDRLDRYNDCIVERGEYVRSVRGDEMIGGEVNSVIGIVKGGEEVILD